MKTITLKNGMVIFVEQIAFIHIQPSTSKENINTPEIHVHFPAGLSGPKGSRSMRAVIMEGDSSDFITQLEKHGVDGSYMRQRITELITKKIQQ